MVQTAQQERIRLLPDILRGAFLGDYATRLGIAGAITQAIVFYIPIVGTLCAMRDYFASRRRRDTLSAFLNLLAIFPILGGFPKTAAVIHNFGAVHHAVKATQIATGHAHGREFPPRISNPLAGLSLLTATATPLLLLLPSLFQAPPYAALAGVAAPLVAVLAGHLALHRASQHPESHARRGTARVGLTLGYFYLFALAVSFGILVMHGVIVLPSLGQG